MNSVARYLLAASIILILVLQCGCAVSGEIKFGTPAGKIKIKSEHKKDHHEKDDDEHHKKKKKDHKKKHHDDD